MKLPDFGKVGAGNYQKIVENLNAGILFNDANGDLIFANTKATEILHTTQSRLYQFYNIEDLWNNFWNITNEKGEKVLYSNNPVMKALRTGKLQEDTLVIKMADGEKRWILFDSQPLFEQDGKTSFSVVSNIIDVTEEKRLSLQLNELDTIFKVFIDRTPNHAWIIDEEENLIYASRSFYDYFGIKKENSEGKKIAELIPEAVFKSLYEKHIEVLKTGEPVEFEDKVELADGSELVFHVDIFPIESPSGKMLLGGHSVSLADKYQLVKQLRETNDRLLNFNRTVSNAIWEWDLLTGAIFQNENLLEMIGYPKEKNKGISWWLRRIHPDDRERVEEKVKETIDKKKLFWEDEYRFKCSDGEYKPMYNRGFIVYENELPVKMIGSLQDMTEVKLLRDQLSEEKEQRQKKITESVIKAQERERRRIGQELHDNVNQILTTAKLFMEMIDPADKEEREAKEKSVEYILEAIEEIRKLSRELSAPWMKNKSLVEVFCKLAEDINSSGKLSVKFDHDAGCDLLSPGQKITLFRILQEQMKNILNYSKATEAQITLGCHSNHVALSIKDNGIGFDAAHTRTGVGLSGIYDRAGFYDGTVTLDTAPGKGCTLTVKIPLS